MSHPMQGQAQASQKARLKRLGGTPGKAWGSSQMYRKKSYPKKNAGTQREMTISGSSSSRRADRMAGGGAVGGKKRSHKPHHTTNIVIAAPGGAGGRGGNPAAAAPALRPPLPPVRPPIAAPPIAPPAAAPVGAVPPLGGGMGAAPPVAPRPAAPPPLPPRPPMMAAAAPVRPPLPGMKAGGAVRRKNGGDAPGRSYPGYPHSPTSGDTDAVSAHANGGRVGRYRFGGLKKKVLGPMGNNPNPTIGSSGADASLQVPAAGGLGTSGGLNTGFTAPTAPTPTPGADAAVSDKRGGTVKKVKKRQEGGSLKQGDDDDDASQERVPPASGAQAQKRGGKVAKRQMGGGMQMPQQQQQQMNTGVLGLGSNPALRSTPQQQGPANISGTAARKPTPLMIPPPANAAAALRARPAPGTMVGFKRGGSAKHDDEAEDKALFRKMMKEEKRRGKA